jgi:hypothetical protein
MPDRKKPHDSERPTGRLLRPTDDPFDTEPPTDLASKTDPPEAEIPEATPSEARRRQSTSPELGYYVCPACHAENPAACDTCMGMGIIDRDTMDDWKKKEN